MGDDVLLRTINIHLKGNLTKKLLPKWAGPFKVIGKIGNSAYELEIPPTMPVHPVFHTGRLKPWNVNSRVQPPPKPVIVDGLEEDHIDSIVDHKYARRGKARSLSYLVKWKGHGPEHNTLEPANALTDCEALEHYKKNRMHVDEENAHTAS